MVTVDEICGQQGVPNWVDVFKIREQIKEPSTPVPDFYKQKKKDIQYDFLYNPQKHGYEFDDDDDYA